jgi:tetratricopeptide (TPR) repeat protein
MKALRCSVAAVLLVWAVPATLAETKAWQDTLSLPTWLEGPPETIPRIEAIDPSQALFPYITYPYSVRLNFTKQREPQEWRRLNLENEYLSCSFLPDLGGRLYNCIDKLNGRPIFYANSSIKKAGIAVRGAWVALGVEWNFPVAHSRDTASPVNFGFRQEKDRAEVWVGDVDRVTGMEWLAEFVLRDGSAVLEQRVTLRNATGVRHPYSWWANAEASLDEGTRFIYPVHVMSNPGLTKLDSWPRSQAGTDVADSGTVPGKKLCSWGDRFRETMHALLTDDNTWDVETQAGLFENQETPELAALESRAGHADAALDFAIKAIARDKSLHTAWKLQVALLRRAGKVDEARRQLEQARAIDPVDSLMRLEAIQLGANDDALWLHLAAGPERVLEIAGAYFEFGMCRDAMTVLDHTYPAVPGNQTEPGAVLPQDYPLVAYYRAYCRQMLGQSGAADFKAASSQGLEYVFPNRTNSLAPLEAAVKEDPQDGSAHFLLGLLRLNDNWTVNAVAELQAAKAIRRDIPELYFALGGALLSSKDGKAAAPSVLQEGIAAAPSKALKALLAQSAAPAPKPPSEAATGAAAVSGAANAATQKPSTPAEIAEHALSLAADGELVAAVALFTAENFPQEKQSESVRMAYLEIQLQALRSGAAHHSCAEALRGVASIGGKDESVPFTLGGFGDLMKSARFQYYLGAVESLCRKSRAAHQRWSEVARMTPEIFSPDFSFPAVAAQSLAAKGKGPKIQPWLDQVSKALESATGDVKGTLLYSKGVLLLALGEESAGLAEFEEGPAIGAFQEGAKAPDFGMSRYLNNLVLREARSAGHK